jgi:hypothetical protein
MLLLFDLIFICFFVCIFSCFNVDVKTNNVCSMGQYDFITPQIFMVKPSQRLKGSRRPSMLICQVVYMNICIHTYSQSLLKVINAYTHIGAHFVCEHMQDASFHACACSYLTCIQPAIHTLPAMTNMSHMPSKSPATCHYSQIFKGREALEHALRQRRDLVNLEIAAQGHRHGENGEAAAS